MGVKLQTCNEEEEVGYFNHLISLSWPCFQEIWIFLQHCISRRMEMCVFFCAVSHHNLEEINHLPKKPHVGSCFFLCHKKNGCHKKTSDFYTLIRPFVVGPSDPNPPKFKNQSWWVFPKIVGFPPKSSHFNKVFHYFHHPFWGFYPYFWKHPKWSEFPNDPSIS